MLEENEDLIKDDKKYQIYSMISLLIYLNVAQAKKPLHQERTNH